MGECVVEVGMEDIDPAHWRFATRMRRRRTFSFSCSGRRKSAPLAVLARSSLSYRLSRWKGCPRKRKRQGNEQKRGCEFCIALFVFDYNLRLPLTSLALTPRPPPTKDVATECNAVRDWAQLQHSQEGRCALPFLPSLSSPLLTLLLPTPSPRLHHFTYTRDGNE